MRSVRVLLSAAALSAVALLGGSACAAASAANVAGVWVQVNPSTIQPGSAVTIRASCGDENNSATVSSKAFPTTTVSPLDGVLGTSVQVPATTAAGTYSVDLACRTGSKASTTLTVLAGAVGAVPADREPPQIGPHTGGGFLATGEESRTPLLWLGSGLAALLAAALLAVRAKKRAVRQRGR